MDGPACAGDLVSLMVFGIADVAIAPDADVEVGDRLTAAALPGTARSLQTRDVDGMTVTEGAPVIGIVLAAPSPGRATIPVFVTLR